MISTEIAWGLFAKHVGNNNENLKSQTQTNKESLTSSGNQTNTKIKLPESGGPVLEMLI